MIRLEWKRSELLNISVKRMENFFFTMALPAHSRPGPLIQFRDHFSQTVGLLGRVISSSQGLYLNTEQQKRIHTPNIHALTGIRTHDPSVRASEDSTYLRPRGHCGRHTDTFHPDTLYISSFTKLESSLPHS
jgi:hypothetical protein